MQGRQGGVGAAVRLQMESYACEQKRECLSRERVIALEGSL